MSVGAALSWWNDPALWNGYWSHIEDKSEPPEPAEDGRTCRTCCHWERCPCGCEWGLCTKGNDFIHEDAPKCVYWEEA